MTNFNFLSDLEEAPRKFVKDLKTKDFFISEGGRNHQLASEAGKLRHLGYELEELEEQLLKINDERCFPPLEVEEVLQVARSISKYEKQKAPACAIKTVLLEDMLNDTSITDPTPIVEGLLNRDEFHICSATAKTGKTFLQTHLAIAVTLGDLFLGKFRCKPGKVIIIQTELSDNQYLKRVKLVAGDKIDAVKKKLILSNTRIKIDTKQGLKALKDVLIEHEPDLLILDPFYTLHNKNEDLSTDIAPILSDLKELIIAHKCSIFLIHHQGKAARDSQPGHQHRGSSSFADVPDGSWSLTREQDPNFAKINFELRNLEAPGPFLLRKLENQVWEVSQEYHESSKKAGPKDIEAIVAENPGINTSELHGLVEDQLGIKQRRASQLVRSAEKYKYIVTQKNGRQKLHFACDQIHAHMHSYNSSATVQVSDRDFEF